MTITLNEGTNQALLAINNGPDSKMIRKALEATLEDVAQVTRDASGNVVGLSAGGEAMPAWYGPKKWATLGDSIASQNFYSSSGLAYPGMGWLIWAMARLGWPADYQSGDDFAINGVTTRAVIDTQIPLLREANKTNRYERVFISTGTNDSDNSLATMISEQQELIDAVNALGIIPVHIGILPRNNNEAMTDAKRKNIQVNNWLSDYAARTGKLEFIQGCHEAVADNSTDYGNAILAMMDENVLHPLDNGAYYIGDAIYNYYAGMGWPTILKFAQSQADKFDKVYNKAGVLFTTANPLLLGTAGTAPYEYPTGMLTAGTNCTWTKGTRALANGQTRETCVCTIAGATGATSAYLYDDAVATGGWDTENTQVGDVVYGQAIVEITTGGAGIRTSLTLAEKDGSTTINATCLTKDLENIDQIPDGTILTLRTPNITVRPYAGSGNASLFLKLNVFSPAATGVVTVLAFEMRKVVD